jgi:hypothetical protein
MKIGEAIKAAHSAFLSFIFSIIILQFNSALFMWGPAINLPFKQVFVGRSWGSEQGLCQAQHVIQVPEKIEYFIFGANP